MTIEKLKYQTDYLFNLQALDKINEIVESSNSTAQEVSDGVDDAKLTKSAFLAAGTNLAAKLPNADTSATIVSDTPKTLLKEWDKLSANLSHVGGIVEQAGITTLTI